MRWADELANMVRREAQRALSHLVMPSIGIVTNYDPAHHAARVQLQPENVLTGYLPVTEPWVGDGWGMYAPPSPGDAVEVHFQQGGAEAGFIVNRFYSAKVKPLSVPAGEFWLVHKTGTKLKFTNDGNVLIEAAENLRIAAKNIKLHASQTFAFDANGQGQKWDGQGVETWQDDDIPKPHHNHAPPETP